MKAKVKAKAKRRSDAANRMHVIIELPPGSADKTVRKFKILEKTTAGQMAKLLAKHLKVEQGNWRLYGRSNEASTHLLDKNASLEKYKYSSDKGATKARLYFYPEFRL
jgi:hypothetical protein